MKVYLLIDYNVSSLNCLTDKRKGTLQRYSVCELKQPYEIPNL